MGTLNKEAVISEAKILIKDFLDKYCNENDSPFVCDYIKTKGGYDEVEQFILRRMTKGDAVSEAVMLKERLLDPNRLVD